jgi:hypothetical protein
MPSKSKASSITDHDEIRRWAEERGAQPACVRNTGSRNGVVILRLELPSSSSKQALEMIEWNEWFEKFEEQGLALIHQETLANGKKSNFSKLVSRETANARDSRSRSAHSGKASTSKSKSAKSAKSASRKPAEVPAKTAAKGRTAKPHTHTRKAA